MCGEAKTTEHIFECRGQEDKLNKQMYEEIMIRVEAMEKKKLKEQERRSD